MPEGTSSWCAMPMTSSPALNTRPMPSGFKQNCGVYLVAVDGDVVLGEVEDGRNETGGRAEIIEGRPQDRRPRERPVTIEHVAFRHAGDDGGLVRIAGAER